MKQILVPLVISIFIILYSIYFHIAGSITKEDLGPLGDFIGGNMNPLLTFLSTILLIDTVIIQRTAAKDSKISETEARKTIELQSRLATKQSFESSLFNLWGLCLSEYKSTNVKFGSHTYSGSQAFSKYVELFEHHMLSNERRKLLNKLEELTSDALFDNIKNFSTAFKFIDQYSPASDRENYISLCLTMMPTSLIQLLCIAKNHSSWPILSSFERCGIFERESLQDFIINY